MDRPYIEELHVENYGCIKDATFQLTPLHALIGPNSSGKSTALRALLTLAFRLQRDERQAALVLRALETRKAGTIPRFAASTRSQTFHVESQTPGTSVSSVTGRGSPSGPQVAPLETGVGNALRRATLLRLDPDALRKPHSLLPDAQPLRFDDDRGTGLPAIYDAILARDLATYQAINAELTRLFPDVESIRLTTLDPHTKGMGIKLKDGTFVPAELMSEGLLYYLAFATLPHIDATALLLVEEPENGLHPARIIDVMHILRAISKTTQVIIATHSPLVINELEPDEVTVVTRSRDGGTKATRMKDTANFEERSKIYALGELWLSYANGIDESALLNGGPRP